MATLPDDQLRAMGITPFQPGPRLIDGTELNAALVTVAISQDGFSLEEFGGAADGRTDNGPPMVKALEQIAQIYNTTGIVFPLVLTAGKYLFTTGVNFYAVNVNGFPIVIRGQSRDATIIYIGARSALGGINLTDCPFFDVSNLQVDCNYPASEATPGVHCIRVGRTSTSLTAVDKGTFDYLELRNSPAYGIGFETTQGGYHRIGVDNVRVYNTQRDAFDTKDHDFNEYLQFSNIYAENWSLRDGSDALIDCRGIVDAVNITGKMYPDVASTGMRARVDSDITSPYGGHDCVWANININMGGKPSDPTKGFGRVGMDIGGLRVQVVNANIHNGWSNGTNSAGTRGVKFSLGGQYCTLTNVIVRDQAFGFQINDQNNTFIGCKAFGCSELAPVPFTPAGEGFEFTYDPLNPNPQLQYNGSNNRLIECYAEGWQHNYREISGVTGNVIDISKSGTAIVSVALLSTARTFNCPTLQNVSSVSQGATGGVFGFQVAYNAAGTSGWQVTGTAGNPRFQVIGSGNLDGEIRGLGNGGVRLSKGDGTVLVIANNAGIGFYGASPAAKQAITGALSTVTDAAAKAVLTSIISALSSIGLATNSTT